MSVSYISSASNEGTSVTLPTHQVGDLLLICALAASSTNPTMPDEWANLGNNAGLNSDNLVIGYKAATTASETSGTWAGAAFLLAAIYRHTTNYCVAGRRRGLRSTTGGTSTPTFGQKAARSGNTVPTSDSERMTSAESLVVGIISSPSISVDIDVPPSGMTNRVQASGAAAHRIAIHDTGTPVSSWAQTNATLSAATPWITCVIDLIDTGIPITGGGGNTFAGIRRGIRMANEIGVRNG